LPFRTFQQTKRSKINRSSKKWLFLELVVVFFFLQIKITKIYPYFLISFNKAIIARLLVRYEMMLTKLAASLASQSSHTERTIVE